MITKDQNKALLIVADSVKNKLDWIDYMHYCLEREKGLRKEAFKYLNDFIDKAIKWRLEDKIEFLKHVFPLFETIEDASYGPFPQPLSEKLIKPSLIEWCSFETQLSDPFRWYGIYYDDTNEHLDKALVINPSDDKARIAYLQKITNNIYYSTHHLPDGYIGDPYEDVKESIKAQEHIDLLIDKELKLSWQSKLDSEMELVKNYIEWKESGHPDLIKWGKENKKNVDSGIKHYYYDK
jgi:hypothetical protein